jgi:hypothetical protein
LVRHLTVLHMFALDEAEASCLAVI